MVQDVLVQDGPNTNTDIKMLKIDKNSIKCEDSGKNDYIGNNSQLST